MESPSISRPLTVREQVAHSIRDEIVSGRLEQGKPIQQDELAARLGVSRTPVRQALERLAAEGWVEDRPNRAAIVAPLDPDDCEVLFAIRAELECLAAARSLPLLDDDGRSAIKRAHADLVKADNAHYEATHRAFHMTIYARAGARLVSLIERQFDQAERYLRFERVRMEVGDDDRTEHEAIAQAAVQDDIDALVSTLRPHVAEGGQDIATRLRNTQR